MWCDAKHMHVIWIICFASEVTVDRDKKKVKVIAHIQHICQYQKGTLMMCDSYN